MNNSSRLRGYSRDATYLSRHPSHRLGREEPPRQDQALSLNRLVMAATARRQNRVPISEEKGTHRVPFLFSFTKTGNDGFQLRRRLGLHELRPQFGGTHETCNECLDVLFQYRKTFLWY